MSNKKFRLSNISHTLKYLVASPIAFILFHCNHLLRFLADSLVSEQLDRLSLRYSSWYNLHLIKEVINLTGHGKYHTHSVDVVSQATQTNLVIVQLNYHGFTYVELKLYLLKRLRIIGGIDHDSIQITPGGKGQAKIIFTLGPNYDQ